MSRFADQLTEKCAVAGVWGSSDAGRLTATMLEALQHRGQDATGIVTWHEAELLRHVELGLVADVYSEKILESLKGSVAIGTTGMQRAAEPRTLSIFSRLRMLR